MEPINKIFVVINPASNKQYALQRAVEIAKRHNSEIFAYLCIYSTMESSNLDELKEVVIERHQPWLEKHLNPVREMGIKVDSEIVWNQNWQEEIGNAAIRINPDIIIKGSRRKAENTKLKLLSSDWALFENAPCSVLLANLESKDTGKILMAVDIKRDDEKYAEILERVITHSKSVAESRNAELHAVNSYVNPDDYVHVTDVAKKVGLPIENVHVVGADPEEAIVKVAKEIDAEMVIMGLSTKNKLRNRVFGYTSGSLLNSLSQDVFVVIPKKTESS